jgi:hypothetical protein
VWSTGFVQPVGCSSSPGEWLLAVSHAIRVLHGEGFGPASRYQRRHRLARLSNQSLANLTTTRPVTFGGNTTRLSGIRYQRPPPVAASPRRTRSSTSRSRPLHRHLRRPRSAMPPSRPGLPTWHVCVFPMLCPPSGRAQFRSRTAPFSQPKATSGKCLLYHLKGTQHNAEASLRRRRSG